MIDPHALATAKAESITEVEDLSLIWASYHAETRHISPG